MLVAGVAYNLKKLLKFKIPNVLAQVKSLQKDLKNAFEHAFSSISLTKRMREFPHWVSHIALAGE